MLADTDHRLVNSSSNIQAEHNPSRTQKERSRTLFLFILTEKEEKEAATGLHPPRNQSWTPLLWRKPAKTSHRPSSNCLQKSSLPSPRLQSLNQRKRSQAAAAIAAAAAAAVVPGKENGVRRTETARAPSLSRCTIMARVSTAAPSREPLTLHCKTRMVSPRGISPPLSTSSMTFCAPSTRPTTGDPHPEVQNTEAGSLDPSKDRALMEKIMKDSMLTRRMRSSRWRISSTSLGTRWSSSGRSWRRGGREERRGERREWRHPTPRSGPYSRRLRPRRPRTVMKTTFYIRSLNPSPLEESQ